jgi:hypothetical protein
LEALLEGQSVPRQRELGSQRGITLDRRSIVEFMGAAGLGMVSQVLEGFARRLTGGIGRTIAGKTGGRIGDVAGGMAMSFGSTYALGQLATLYFDSGRSLSMEALRSKYPPLLSEGRVLAEKYASKISHRSQQLEGTNMANLLKGVI